MKLNKVLALALSGIMAVSMLAGCSTGNKDDNTDEGTVVTTNAAEVLNKAQSTVKFADDATLNGYMAAVDSLKPSVVKNLEKTTLGSLTTSDAAVTAIKDKMISKDAANVAANFNTFSTDGSTAANKDDKTQTVFYAINAEKVISIEHLMTKLSDTMNTSTFKTKVSIASGADKGDYTASYTGAVSVKKVSATDENGNYDAYVVAVSVTRTLGDKLV